MVLHAIDAVEPDRTLCGIAEEGACMGNKEDDELPIFAKPGEIITCEICRMIIVHCRNIVRGKKSFVMR